MIVDQNMSFYLVTEPDDDTHSSVHDFNPDGKQEALQIAETLAYETARPWCVVRVVNGCERPHTTVFYPPASWT